MLLKRQQVVKKEFFTRALAAERQTSKLCDNVRAISLRSRLLSNRHRDFDMVLVTGWKQLNRCTVKA